MKCALIKDPSWEFCMLDYRSIDLYNVNGIIWLHIYELQKLCASLVYSGITPYYGFIIPSCDGWVLLETVWITLLTSVQLFDGILLSHKANYWVTLILWYDTLLWVGTLWFYQSLVLAANPLQDSKNLSYDVRNIYLACWNEFFLKS